MPKNMLKTMPKNFILPAVMIAALGLAACNNSRPITGRDLVGVAGAIGGGYLGSELGEEIGSGSGQDIARVVGASLGALAGRELALRLTNVDQQQLVSAARNAFSTGQPQQWSNPQTGNAGS